jgi:hypothetical protein
VRIVFGLRFSIFLANGAKLLVSPEVHFFKVIFRSLFYDFVSSISKIAKEKYRNIFKGAYETPDKYIPKNKTRKIKKNYL